MSKYYYQTPIDSPTGERISRFWHQCSKCEQAAEDYAKKMGATFFYSDPRYFAGGVVCIAFAEGQRIDKKVWRTAGIDHSDGMTYYEPAVQSRTDLQEIPNRDYALKDSADRIYNRHRIVERDGKLYVPYVEFYGEQGTRSLRKAIKAEIMRRRLPVMHTKQLLAILADTTVAATANVSEVSPSDVTPTFFPFRSRYVIGTDQDCSSNHDLEPITPRYTSCIYKLNCRQAVDGHSKDKCTYIPLPSACYKGETASRLSSVMARCFSMLMVCSWASIVCCIV